ncbi:MAG TPA: phage terminase large subunit family protein [Kiritimatiellia bacterium]|nr:phage terminase large subunit family protein [Kiritimatiellia bacterium]
MSQSEESARRAVLADAKRQRHIEAGRKIARVQQHEDPPPEVCRKRKRLEADFPAWLRFHGGEAFAYKWSPDHLAVLAKIKEAIDKGGHFALAMPRGHGKTTILKWSLLYVMLTGKRRYVVVVAATAELAGALTDFVRAQLIENPTLLEHYPHVCHYAKATEGKAIKAKYMLRRDFKPLGLGWGKATLILPTPMGRDAPYPSDGAVLEGHGLTGAIRGKWRDDKAGKVMRPDFVLLDDPQTRESAESPSQCAMRERIITGDVLGLAGPRKKIAAVMPCTVIRKGDLAHRFLDHAVHPEWQGMTFQLVKKWPDAQDTLWKEYADILREGLGNGEGSGAATAYYKKNRAAMDAGAEVAWAARVRDGEISAIQTAENLLIESGSQFWAEYQNEPQDVASGQYELTIDQILAHATDLPRLHLPERSAVLCGHIDINRVGLHWVMAGFDQQMTAHVAAYSRFPPHGELWPENAPELVIGQAITRGLTDLCNAIAGTAFIRGQSRMTPSLVLVDASFNSETVHRFCENWRGPFRVMPAIGRAASRYSWNKSTIIGRPMEQCHRQRPQKRICPYVMFNACYWREVAQRAFLGAPGEAGGCTLFNAGSPRAHGPFAEHVTAERLAEKFPSPAGDMVWKWNPPTGHNDWGDALTGAYVAAAMEGITTSGAPVETGLRRRKVYSASDFRK